MKINIAVYLKWIYTCTMLKNILNILHLNKKSYYLTSGNKTDTHVCINDSTDKIFLFQFILLKFII